MSSKLVHNWDRLFRLAGLIIIVAFLPALCSGQEEKPVVHRIRFEGNESFNSKALREQMRTIEEQPEDSFQITRDLGRIISFYRDNGYLDAKIVKTKRIPDLNRKHLITYVLVIEEREPYTISSVEIEGVEKFDLKELRKLLATKPGDILKIPFIYYSEFRIREFYTKRGYIYCRVDYRLETSPTVRKSMILTFRVDEGNQVRVGDVSISGNASVRSGIIKREIVIKPKEIFDPSKAYRSQSRIYSTGLFTDVRFEVIGEEEKRDKVDLIFHVVEGKPRWIALGGGYQSPDRVSFYMHWGHDNIFNNGQKLKLETSFSFNLEGEHEENFGITHREPYLFNSAFQGELHLFHNREFTEHYDVIESGGNSRVGRYIGENIEAFAQYQFKTSSVEVYGDPSETPEQDLITNSVSISLTRDNRDNIFDPRTGTLAGLRAEYAGGILGGDNDFYRAVGDISAFYNPIARIVFGVRARGGYIEPFGYSKSVPFEETFALRGSDAIRGYAEQNLKEGDNCLTTFNVEMRFPLFRIFGKYLGLAYFVDMGRVWPKWDKVSLKEMNIGAGAGIRGETPIGPLRLDYARNIRGRSDTDYGRIYFGIGHMF